jgi:hypothetical protein
VNATLATTPNTHRATRSSARLTPLIVADRPTAERQAEHKQGSTPVG